MSGIAGICHLSGEPVDPARLERMTDVIAHRGPDDVNHWVKDHVALGHRMLRTTPESVREIQPLFVESANLCVTLDGRVDNREELEAGLKARGARLRSDTDAEMVLRAYECWGEDAPTHIIGDFAFAIWDGLRNRLFCARDIIGTRPFYYWADARTFVFGSEVRQLFEGANVPLEPNEGMIGEYLASAITHKEETLFRGVYRLPPAHSLVVESGGLTTRRYWQIDAGKTTRYQDDGEYAEHFAEIFREAVRCRLRSNTPVAVQLSGGLDSSAILGQCADLSEQETDTAPPEAFSTMFPGLPCDESSYINDVVQMWKIESHHVEPGDTNSCEYEEQAHRYLDFPDYPNSLLFYPLFSLAREKGTRVLLNGAGGDDWLTGSFYHYADLLRRLRFGSLLRQLRWDSRVPGASSSVFPLSSLLQSGVKPLLPSSARGIIRRLMRRSGVPPWIDSRYARRIMLAERLRDRTDRPSFASYAQQDLFDSGTCGWQVHGYEMGDRTLAWFGLEERHPLNDRRLVEFAVSLPEDQRWRRSQTKFVLRQAAGHLLPRKVRERLGKAEFSVGFARALQLPRTSAVPPPPLLTSMGLINETETRRMYREMDTLYQRGSTQYTSYVWPLWMVHGIELWLQTVFVDGSTAHLSIGERYGTTLC